MNCPPPLFILGATAIGKSEVALALARKAAAGSTAILCLDAMQVYRGADIGTGKPSALERAEFPHGGLDLAEVGESFDVAAYLRHAATFMAEHQAVGRRVLIVGGTGFYFRALTQGLCAAPSAPAALRAEISALSLPALQERLRRVDPSFLNQLDQQNPRRLARAIEVMESTGRSLAAWQAETPPPLLPDYHALWLQRARDDLPTRIAARVDSMFAAGWADEVARLLEKYGKEAMGRFVALGYREIADKLPFSLPDPDLRESITRATRHYANRQLTWFAREPNLQKVMMPVHSSFASLATLQEIASF